MRIAVVHPRDRVRDFNVFAAAMQSPTVGGLGFEREFSTFEPELLALASGLRSRGVAVDYIDLNLEDSFEPAGYDQVVAGGVTCQAEDLLELARVCRSAHILCTLAGPWPTLQPEVCLVDAPRVLAGPVAAGTELILDDTARGVLIAGQSTTIPLLDLSLLNGKMPPVYPLLASRGCLRGCEFCTVTATAGPGFRREPRAVRADVEAVMVRDPNAAVVFVDDNSTVERDWLLALCAELAPLGVNWSTHMDIAAGGDEEILRALQSGGCRRVFLGLESLSAAALAKLATWKAARIGHYGEWLDQFHRAGIGTLVSFILGLEEEGDAVTDIRRFVFQHHPRALSLSLLTPMPGTRLFERYQQEEKIVETRLSRYTQFYPVLDFGSGQEKMIADAQELLLDFHGKAARSTRIKHLKKQLHIFET